MSGRRAAFALFLFCLLLTYWRYRAVGLRVEANSVAAISERNLAAALHQRGGSLPRRFLEDSLARLEKARELDPASVEVAVSQAGFLFLLHRYEQAEKIYLEAIEIEERAEIYANLARLYLQQNRPGDAIKPLRKAILIDPQLAPTLEQMLENAQQAFEAQEAAAKAQAQNLSRAEIDRAAGLIFGDDFEGGDTTRWSVSRRAQRS